MEKPKNDFFRLGENKMDVIYEGKRYNCVELDYILARGDTDYCRDETWFVYCPEENIFFSVHDTSFRGGGGHWDITKIQVPDKHNEATTDR